MADDPRDAEAIPVQLAPLEPADEVLGLQRRLADLGFLPGAIDGEVGALRAYDAETVVAHLTERHGY